MEGAMGPVTGVCGRDRIKSEVKGEMMGGPPTTDGVRLANSARLLLAEQAGTPEMDL